MKNGVSIGLIPTITTYSSLNYNNHDDAPELLFNLVMLSTEVLIVSILLPMRLSPHGQDSNTWQFGFIGQW